MITSVLSYEALTFKLCLDFSADHYSSCWCFLVSYSRLNGGFTLYAEWTGVCETHTRNYDIGIPLHQRV